MSILEQVSTKEVVSFKDCPNHCVSGYLFDPYSHKKTLCPYCDELRRKQIQGAVDVEDNKDIYTKLNIRKSYTGSFLSLDNVIPKESQGYLVETSLKAVWTELEGLGVKLTAAELPEHSLLFNLGFQAYCENAIYPLLLKAYRSGLSTLPLLTGYMINKAKKEFTMDKTPTTLCTYDEIVTYDVCIIHMESGCDYTEIKGVMQQRALIGKPTILFNNNKDGNYGYLYDLGTPLSCSLAKRLAVEVDEDRGIQIKQITNILNVLPTTDEDLRLLAWNKEDYEETMRKIKELQGELIMQGHLGAFSYGKLKVLLNKKIQYLDPSKKTPHKDSMFGMGKEDFMNLKKSLSVL